MKPAAVILFFGVVGACLVCIGGAGPAAAGGGDPIKALKQEKLKVAEEWFKVYLEREKLGAATDEEERKAVIALKDAQLDIADNKKQRVMALTEFRDRMKSIYEKAEVKKHQKGYSDLTAAEAKVELLDAEIKLREEEKK